METVTFYSYKGGSGRTLLLANAARSLALAGRKVVAVDLDFEAPGLHYKLHIGHSGERTAEVVPARGVVDYLLATHAGNGPVNPVEFLTEVPLPPDSTGRLYLMPAGSAPSAEYWRGLTDLSRHSLGSDGETLLAGLLELKARVEDELGADALLIDARTGITELGGIATTILPDKVVCLLLDNEESLTGARTVIRSFTHAARLTEQQPIQVIPVLSRVPEPTLALKKRVLDFLNEASEGRTEGSDGDFTQLFFLRDDRGLAEEEHLFFEGYQPLPPYDGPGIRGLRPPRPDLSKGLGRDYVELIGLLFSSGGASEPAAFRRQEAVSRMREWLTEEESHRRHRSIFPRAFDSRQIDEGVKLDDQRLDYVDLLAYSGDRAPLVAALYSEDLEPLKNWEWPRAGVRCIFLFKLDDQGRLETKAFTRGRTGSFTEVSDPPGSHRSVEWTLRIPAVYAALSDPGDQTVGALLASVQNGDDTFVPLLVREWQHASYITLHGGMPFRPKLAREILDGLAAVSDVEAATHILWRTAPDPFERTDEGMHEGASLEEMTSRNLHAPLFWRLPVAAKVRFWQHGRDRTTIAGVEMLARDLIGLRFDQDQDLRDDAERIAKLAPIPQTMQRLSEDDDASDLEHLEHAVGVPELKFEFSTAAPPELVRRAMIGTLVADSPKVASWEHAETLAEKALESDAALGSFLRDETGRRSIITTNLLARYEPANATVTLFTRLLEWSARVLDVALKDLENVVFLHETIHAICHLGRDLDGRDWSEFALPSSRELTFSPSEQHEALAQYFTLRMIERLEDSGMLRAFEVLSKNQPRAYRAWEEMRSTSVEEVRKLLIAARTGFAGQRWHI